MTCPYKVLLSMIDNALCGFFIVVRQDSYSNTFLSSIWQLLVTKKADMLTLGQLRLII